MSKPITDSTAYVGRYADKGNTSWPWWAFVLLVPMLVVAVPFGWLGNFFQRIR